MLESTNGDRRYEIHYSGATASRIRRLHRQAKLTGRGQLFAAALRYIVERLKRDPHGLGEPLHRLTRGRVRVFAMSPLKVHFAVFNDLPVALITQVDLLP